MVDIKTIEQWLWEAACSIRGALDAPKFKDYILPLVFLKRLSDVYDDERLRLCLEMGTDYQVDELIAKDHSLVRFYVPNEAKWDEVRKGTVGLGERVTDAMRTIAKENPRLQGVVDVVDFNATVSGQRMLDDDRLSRLIEVISKHRLGLKDAEPDVLGRAYEYLLRKFAEGQGQSAGEFYTPKEVGFLMAYILDPEEGQTVYDPTCGSGGLLVKCELVLKEKNEAVEKPLKLYGQEYNHVTFAMAKMNMIIHDMEGEIAIGDTLKNPKFLQGNALKQFDLVTANPMWNQDGYDAEFYENDSYSRFPFGYPNGSSADWGWVQHMLASLNKTGRAAVVLDTGAVARGSGNKGSNRERDIRKACVEKDLIESVILLPDNLFYNTTSAGIILILSKDKKVEHKGKVVLINASKEWEKSKESSKNYIPEPSVKKIAQAFHSFKDIDSFAKVVGLEELEKSDYNLSPSRFVEVEQKAETRNIPELLQEIQQLESEDAILNKELNTIFKQLGF